MAFTVSDFQVVIPWRGVGVAIYGLRQTALDSVKKHLAGLDYLITVAAEPWSPGASRNLGAALVDAPVVVFNDADTLVPRQQIRDAVQLAAESPGLVYAYDLYLRRDRNGRIERHFYMPPSFGCVAISRESFNELGGFLEGFAGWGYEDCEFAERAGRRWPNRRVSGVAEHIWHGDRRDDDSPTDADPVQVERNKSLWMSARTA